MKKYRNYIFDLYGTLMDIHTEERSPALWRFMEEFYEIYGVIRSAKDLEETFFALDQEERVLLASINNVGYPEIKLEKVFVRLLFEGGKIIDTGRTIEGNTVREWKKRYDKDREGVLNRLIKSEWVFMISNLFRIRSRRYIRPFPNTVATLERLRENGAHIYLLSNAQEIFTMPEILKFELDKLFDRMYISSDLGVMKPEGAFLEALISDEGLNRNESVMIGNEVMSDMAIARKCSLDGILLNTAHIEEKEIRKEIASMKKKIRPDAIGNPAAGKDSVMDSSMTGGSARIHIISSGDIAEIL